MNSNARKVPVSELGHILPTAENPNTPPHAVRYLVNTDSGIVRIVIDDADEVMRTNDDLRGMYSALCLYEFPHCYTVRLVNQLRHETLFIFQLHRQLACVVVNFIDTHNVYVIKQINIDDVAKRIAYWIHGNSIDDACKIAASETASRRMSFPAYLGGR